MKILALTILFILMIFTIKDTPILLSKTLWRKKMIRILTKNKESNNGEPLSNTLQGTSILIFLFYELFFNYFLHSSW